MCQKKQFYHHKNVWTVSIVKFEFLGYNVIIQALKKRSNWLLSPIFNQFRQSFWLHFLGLMKQSPTGWPICSWKRLCWQQFHLGIHSVWGGTDVNITFSASTWVMGQPVFILINLAHFCLLLARARILTCTVSRSFTDGAPVAFRIISTTLRHCLVSIDLSFV